MWVWAPSLVRKIAREKCPFLTNCDMCFLFVLETDPIPHSQDLDAVLKFYWVLYWMRRESELFLLSGFNSGLFIVRVEDERQERRKKAVKWGLQENRRGSEKGQDGSVLWWKQNIQLRVQSHSFPNSSEKERNKLNTSNTILPWNTNTYYTPSLSKHRANSQICVLELSVALKPAVAVQREAFNWQYPVPALSQSTIQKEGASFVQVFQC